MKFIKSTAVALLLTLPLNIFAVNAALIDDLKVSTDNQSVHIAGKLTDYHDNIVSYTIEYGDKVYAMGQERLTGSNVDITAKLPVDSPTGDYTLTVNTPLAYVEDDESRYTFSYVSVGDKNKILTLFNNGTSTEITDTFTKEHEYYTYYKSITNYIDYCTDFAPDVKDTVADLIITAYENDSRAYTLGNVASLFNKIIVYTDIAVNTSSDVADKLKEYADIIGIEYTPVIDEAYMATRIRALTPVDGFAKIGETYYEAQAISALSAIADYKLIYDCISEYNDIFKLDLSDYADLTSKQKTQAMKDMIGTYTTLEDIRTAYDDAVTPPAEPSGNTPSQKRSPQVSMTTPIVQTQPQQAVIFTDIADVAWAQEAINELYKKGVINGTSEGIYSPHKDVTRAEFVKLILNALGITASGECSYEDVSADHWAYKYIAAASNAGIVQGADGSFNPESSITRQDMTVIIRRALEFKASSLKSVRELVQFADEADISDYAADAVANLYTAGIINGRGDGIFAPKATATRAEAAKMIYEVIKAEVSDEE